MQPHFRLHQPELRFTTLVRQKRGRFAVQNEVDLRFITYKYVRTVHYRPLVYCNVAKLPQLLHLLERHLLTLDGLQWLEPIVDSAVHVSIAMQGVRLAPPSLQNVSRCQLSSCCQPLEPFFSANDVQQQHTAPIHHFNNSDSTWEFEWIEHRSSTWAFNGLHAMAYRKSPRFADAPMDTT